MSARPLAAAVLGHPVLLCLLCPQDTRSLWSAEVCLVPPGPAALWEARAHFPLVPGLFLSPQKGREGVQGPAEVSCW